MLEGTAPLAAACALLRGGKAANLHQNRLIAGCHSPLEGVVVTFLVAVELDVGVGLIISLSAFACVEMPGMGPYGQRSHGLLHHSGSTFVLLEFGHHVGMPEPALGALGVGRFGLHSGRVGHGG